MEQFITFHSHTMRNQRQDTFKTKNILEATEMKISSRILRESLQDNERTSDVYLHFAIYICRRNRERKNGIKISLDDLMYTEYQ